MAFAQGCMDVRELIKRIRRVQSLCVGLVIVQGCTAPHGPLVVTDPDPSIKIPAIEKAVREKNQSTIPQLIKDLDNDDPAIRFYANHALEELTGQHFGYHYYDDEIRREPAAQKWRQWLADPGSNQGKVMPAATTTGSGPS